jgi:hypothetical protein
MDKVLADEINIPPQVDFLKSAPFRKAEHLDDNNRKYCGVSSFFDYNKPIKTLAE